MMRKGIIYRELYLNKKRYIVGFVVYIAMLFIGVLLRMSMSFGNLANAEEEVFNGMDMVTYYMFTLATPVILIISFAETPEIIVSDYKTNRLKFSYTFPISPKETALYKTGMLLCGYLFSVIVSVVNFCIFCPLCGRKFDIFNFKIMLIIIFIFCLTTATEQILIYRFKNVTVTQVTMSIIFTVILATSSFAIIIYSKNILKEYVDNSDKIEEEAFEMIVRGMIDNLKNFIDVFVIFVPFLIAGIFVIEYFLIKKILSRREK